MGEPPPWMMEAFAREKLVAHNASFELRWLGVKYGGSCADLIKAAMVKVASVMPSDVQLVATVHDELVLDAPADTAKQYCNMTRYAMEAAFAEIFGNAVPVEVEAKVCTNWAEK
jgi:DNA polymerase I-like protein with 3'-5' exonuclease and polymerase domains